jgi:hypothetical protein
MGELKDVIPFLDPIIAAATLLAVFVLAFLQLRKQ